MGKGLESQFKGPHRVIARGDSGSVFLCHMGTGCAWLGGGVKTRVVGGSSRWALPSWAPLSQIQASLPLCVCLATSAAHFLLCLCPTFPMCPHKWWLLSHQCTCWLALGMGAQWEGSGRCQNAFLVCGVFGPIGTCRFRDTQPEKQRPWKLREKRELGGMPRRERESPPKRPQR